MNIISNYQSQIANRLAAAQKAGTFDATMKVRNQEGLMQTFSRILSTAEQYVLHDPNKAQDPAVALAVFSKQNGSVGAMGAYSAFNGNSGSNVGVSGAANVRTVDAMDISISAAAFSLIPYLAIERAMADSATNISYQDIVAEFAHGEIDAGETVLGAFSAPNMRVNLALPVKSEQIVNDGDEAKDGKINFGIALMPETMSVTVTSASTTVAEGMDHNGVIYFTGTAALKATVDYRTGVVEFAEIPAGYTVDVTVNIDSTSDETGKEILTVSADYKNVVLIAKPQQLIFKDNNLKNAYLNKLNIQVAGTGLTLDYGEMAVGKLISIYIHYVNKLVVRDTLIAGNMTAFNEGKKGMSVVKRDISEYMGSGAAGSFADTKNDFIKNFYIDLNQRSLDTTGKGLTCLVVGSRGANLLVGTPFFVKSAQFDELNAMIGTFDGIPVVRHQLIDQNEPVDRTTKQVNTAYIYGIYKDPAGNAAPVAFGEFLPVRLTDPVSNYNNPEQIARSMSSYCGTVICVPGLCHRGEIKFA